jgi:hypothetical protein
MRKITSAVRVLSKAKCVDNDATKLWKSQIEAENRMNMVRSSAAVNQSVLGDYLAIVVHPSCQICTSFVSGYDSLKTRGTY